MTCCPPFFYKNSGSFGAGGPYALFSVLKKSDSSRHHYSGDEQSDIVGCYAIFKFDFYNLGSVN